MGNFPRRDYFTVPFQPTGEAAGPTAFSSAVLGAALLLPPAPHSSETNPCCRWVSVLGTAGAPPCLTHFPAACVSDLTHERGTMAGNGGTSVIPWPLQDRGGLRRTLGKQGLPAGAVRPASAICDERWSRENRCAAGAYENICLS